MRVPGASATSPLPQFRGAASAMAPVSAPFLELSTLAGLHMHDDDGDQSAAGGGSIIGVGFVSGVRCLVTASDSAIKGGAICPMGLKKSLRAQEIATREKMPCINLIESAGANLLYQSELFVDGGRVFANMARLSAQGVPQITVVHGSSTAGGAYLPGLSDYVVVVRNQAKIFLAGPLGPSGGSEPGGGDAGSAPVGGGGSTGGDGRRRRGSGNRSRRFPSCSRSTPFSVRAGTRSRAAADG